MIIKVACSGNIYLQEINTFRIADRPNKSVILKGPKNL